MQSSAWNKLNLSINMLTKYSTLLKSFLKTQSFKSLLCYFLKRKITRGENSASRVPRIRSYIRITNTHFTQFHVSLCAGKEDLNCASGTEFPSTWASFFLCQKKKIKSAHCKADQYCLCWQFCRHLYFAYPIHFNVSNFPPVPPAPNEISFAAFSLGFGLRHQPFPAAERNRQK